MSDKAFDKNIINSGSPIITRNREYQLNKQQSTELNTYATWGETEGTLDSMENYVIDKDGKQVIIGSNKAKIGVKSLFNKYAVVFKSDDIRISNNAPLIDTPENRNNIKRNSDCSIKNLVNCSKSGILGSATYDYSDFAYCKHLGKMPNNYMITLRRFPIAINDYIKPSGYNTNNIFPNTEFGDPSKDGSYVPPVSLGCLVTWLGTPGNDLESILSYSYNMSYKELTASMQVETNSDQHNTLNSLFSAFDPKYQQAVQSGMAGNAVAPLFGNLFGGRIKEGLRNPPYSSMLSQDANKVYGPVDRIQDTHIRSDEGLKFNHSFNLTFEYELRAYNNINTRQAMLDLLANILAVTYQAGDFFPGGLRSLGAPQSDLFTNLRVMQTKGGPTEYLNSFYKDVENLTSKAKSYVESNGGIIKTIKEVANSFGGMMLGGLLNSFGRPQKHAMNSLLSPAPVGLWHVTVGNPFHPIMSIGNMILTNTTITHTGPLGLDDFPTGLKVVCELKRAKSRDKRDIEKLYMHGINRIYTHMGTNIEELYKAAPEYKQDREADTKIKELKQKLQDKDISPEEVAAINSTILAVEPGLIEKQKDIKVRYFGTNYMEALKLAAGEISYGSQHTIKTEMAGNQNGKVKGL